MPELILDHWELYPDWYRKQAVTIRTHDGSEQEAFIYTVDYGGQKQDEIRRVITDKAKLLPMRKRPDPEFKRNSRKFFTNSLVTSECRPSSILNKPRFTPF